MSRLSLWLAALAVCLLACVVAGRPADGQSGWPGPPNEPAEARPKDQPKDRPCLVHKTSFVVYPADCNHLGSLFGGKTLAEMDRTAGMTTRRFLYASPVGARDAVTVAVDDVRFHRAGQVKDLVVVTGTVVDACKKAVKVKVDVERETADGGELLAEGVFTFVAYDPATKKAVEHNVLLLPGK